MAAAWGAIDAPHARTTNDLLAHLGFVLIGLVFVVGGARTRVVVRPDSVRIIGTFSASEIARSDLRFVQQAGGRGRPAVVVLRPGTETSGRQLDLTGRPRLRRRKGSAMVPSAMGPKRLARALNVECRPYPHQREEWARKVDNRLDPLPDPAQWDELERRAQELTAESGTTVLADHRTTIGSTTAGFTAPALARHWPVYQREVFTKEWHQVCPVDVAYRRAADGLRAETTLDHPDGETESPG